MGRMKEMYMEMYDHYNGEIPEEISLSEYLRVKELKNAQWKEYEDGLKKSEKTENLSYDDKRNDSINKK